MPMKTNCVSEDLTIVALGTAPVMRRPSKICSCDRYFTDVSASNPSFAASRHYYTKKIHMIQKKL